MINGVQNVDPADAVNTGLPLVGEGSRVAVGVDDSDSEVGVEDLADGGGAGSDDGAGGLGRIEAGSGERGDALSVAEVIDGRDDDADIHAEVGSGGGVGRGGGTATGGVGPSGGVGRDLPLVGVDGGDQAIGIGEGIGSGSDASGEGNAVNIGNEGVSDSGGGVDVRGAVDEDDRAVLDDVVDLRGEGFGIACAVGVAQNDAVGAGLEGGVNGVSGGGGIGDRSPGGAVVGRTLPLVAEAGGQAIGITEAGDIGGQNRRGLGRAVGGELQVSGGVGAAARRGLHGVGGGIDVLGFAGDALDVAEVVGKLRHDADVLVDIGHERSVIGSGSQRGPVALTVGGCFPVVGVAGGSDSVLVAVAVIDGRGIRLQ